MAAAGALQPSTSAVFSRAAVGAPAALAPSASAITLIGASAADAPVAAAAESGWEKKTLRLGAAELGSGLESAKAAQEAMARMEDVGEAMDNAEERAGGDGCRR